MKSRIKELLGDVNIQTVNGDSLDNYENMSYILCVHDNSGTEIGTESAIALRNLTSRGFAIMLSSLCRCNPDFVEIMSEVVTRAKYDSNFDDEIIVKGYENL